MYKPIKIVYNISIETQTKGNKMKLEKFDDLNRTEKKFFNRKLSKNFKKDKKRKEKELKRRR